MQKGSLKEKTVVGRAKQDSEEFLHFSLMDTLPAGHTLVLNRSLGTLSYLAMDGGRVQLLAQQQFTSSEVSLLLPLFESFPYYCPYEALFAHFYHRSVTEQTIERSRRHLQTAQEEGVWDHEMRSIRNMLSRTRFKTRTMGIDISSILETGYLLRFVSTPELTRDA